MRALPREEGVHLVDDDTHALLGGVPAQTWHEGAQTIGPELLVPDIPCLGQPVGVDDQRVAVLEHELALGVRCPLHHSERNGGRRERLDARRPQDERRIVAGVEIAHPAGRGIDL